MGGCQQFALISDCSALVSLTNGRLSEIEELNKPNLSEPSAPLYGQLAERFKQLASELESLDINSPPLDKATTRLSKNLEATSREASLFEKHLLALKEAQVETNVRKQRIAESELRRLGSTATKRLATHKSAVRKINALCRIKG